jgi:UDP-perosamine 4-acetyltransferase
MKRIIGLGVEGHAAVLMELIERAGTFESVTLLNHDDSITVRMVRGVYISGSSESIPELVKERGLRDFFMGLSSVRTREKKRELFKYAVACGLKPFTIAHPRAVISASAQIGKGGCILAGAIISTQTYLAENVTVNIGAMIESDCDIQAHVQLAGGSFVGCGARIGECSYIGTGAYLQPNVHIGDNVIIGPGAVIVEDVADGQVVPGVYRNLPGRTDKVKPG